MLIGISASNPPFKVNQLKASEELKKRMATTPAAGRLIDMAAQHSGISERYVVVPDAEEGASSKFYAENDKQTAPGTDARMKQYEYWSKVLAKDAVQKLIAEHKLNPADIKRIITISCTGFFAPGLDYYLIEEFNIPRSVKRTNIGFMGCAASIIGFNSVLEAMNAANDDNNDTLLVSVEICSLHLQTEPTRDNILANIIFADGCAAAFFSKNQKYKQQSKLELQWAESVLFDNSADFMGWKIGDTGFKMILSAELPKIILREAVPALLNMLHLHGINRNDIKYWALHPGGRAILDVLQQGLDLSEDEMCPSREVLNKFGNMSSASILYVMKELLHSKKNEITPGSLCCAVAFGPGLTMEAALFRGI